MRMSELDDPVANPFDNPENDDDLADYRSSPLLADARPPLASSSASSVGNSKNLSSSLSFSSFKNKLRAASYPSAPRNANSTSPGKPLVPSPLFARSSYHESPVSSPTEEDHPIDAEIFHQPFSKLRSASADFVSALEDDTHMRGMSHLPHVTLQRRSSVYDRERVEVPIAKIRRTSSVDLPKSEFFGEHSSFYSANSESDSCPPLSTSSSEASEVHCVLPTIDTDQRTKRITPQTLARLLAGEFSAHFDRFVIVDCRFDYEYNGGHVGKAVNINTKGALDSLFYPSTSDRVCVVFHCEFSSHRAPRAWAHMRSVDRTTKGMAHYPELFYPDIYVMDGGYKNFFQQYPELCSPQAYVEMKHPDFVESCSEQMAFNEREWGSTRTNVRSRTSVRDGDFGSP